MADEDEENKKPFYEDEDEAEEEQEKRAPTLDPDHRLLLRSAKPLLQSRNAAVRIKSSGSRHYISYILIFPGRSLSRSTLPPHST